MAPHILLINPWIHDFAAYDYWAKPYGLLSLAGLLRHHGLAVSYIDCLDRFHPSGTDADPHARHGRGPYRKRPLGAPNKLAGIGRTYSRYGIDPEWFRRDLAALQPPDLILVTSLMTYWYPGVVETIGILKQVFPDVPVVLGGIYARLCTAHARKHSGADEVVIDQGATIFDVVARHTGYAVPPQFDLGVLDAWPYPAFDLQHRINYIPLLTSRGCPFDCAYCASRYLEPVRSRRTPDAVIREIGFWHHRHGVVDFVFYDDALLVDAAHHAVPLLEGLIANKWPLFLHTPNAIHIRAVTANLARLMKLAGFHTLRLGLETTAFEGRKELDAKVTRAEFDQAVGHLKAAGFAPHQIGAYLLVGLPGQLVAAVEHSIQVVKAAGIQPVLAHYTPIPHTRMWAAAKHASRYDIESDPIYTNNAIFPCQQETFSWAQLSHLKQLAKQTSFHKNDFLQAITNATVKK
jgi:radical SAM superfamily enzyme YgiQ (UPF0313 family)